VHYKILLPTVLVANIFETDFFPRTHKTVKYIQLYTPTFLSLHLSLLPHLGSFKVSVLECSDEMLTSYWLLDGIIISGVLAVGLLQ